MPTEGVTDMKTPIFSIVVPVYKVENWLERCVDALLRQTEPNIEIILVDDGSPDACPALCDAYASHDVRIRVIHKANGGLSDARNAGIAVASGQYVLFVDSDDYIDLDCCERLLPFVQSEADILVGSGITEGGVARLTHNGVTPHTMYSGTGFLKAAIAHGGMPMAAWLYVYRRAFLIEQDLRFKKGIYHEDEEFTPRAFLAAETVMYTAVSFYHYVIRENSITTKTDKRKNAEDLFETCREHCAIFDRLEDDALRCLLKDSLVNKYLSLFQVGRLYQYGAAYLHKDFIAANAYKKQTKRKARLYCLSPRLYWAINHFVKNRNRK